MRMPFCLSCLLSACLFQGATILLHAQKKTDPTQWGERLLVIAPVVGAGTYADPKRPEFAPTATELARAGRSAISYRWEISDDGKSALVEFVARDKKALAGILGAANRPDVKVFERGKHGKSEIEVEFKKFKKDFDLDRFVRGR